MELNKIEEVSKGVENGAGAEGSAPPDPQAERRLWIASRLEKLRNSHVTTTRDEDFDAQLRRLFKVGPDGQYTHHPIRFTAGTETRAIVVIDGAGSGKTTTILRSLRAFTPLAENPETGGERWLHLKVESPATLRSLGASILEKLGITRVSERIKVYEIWAMVRHRLMVQGVTLVYLDEAHDLCQTERVSEMESILKMLKSLMQGDHPVVLVLSGTEKLSGLTQLSDRQAPRRFNILPPMPLQFGYDTERVGALATAYAGHCGLTAHLSEDTISRLIRGSRQRFGTCLDNIINAIEVALNHDAKTLDRGHFEIAWGQLEGCPPSENVFAVADWKGLIFPEEREEEQASSGHGRASAPRSKKKKG